MNQTEFKLLNEKDFVQITKEEIYMNDLNESLFSSYLIFPPKIQYLLYLNFTFNRLRAGDELTVNNNNRSILNIKKLIIEKHWGALITYYNNQRVDPNFFMGFENNPKFNASSFNQELLDIIYYNKDKDSYEKKIEELNKLFNMDSKESKELSIDNFDSLKNYEFIDNLTNKKYKLKIYEVEQGSEERTGKEFQ